MKSINFKSFMLFILLFKASASFAQLESFTYNGHSVELNKKTIEHFGSEYVNALKTNEPDLLLYLNYFVENAYKIQDIDLKADKPGIKAISDLTISPKSKAPAFNPSDISTFNILAYNIQLQTEPQVFKINSGSNVIVVLSKAQFLDKFNSYRNTIK